MSKLVDLRIELNYQLIIDLADTLMMSSVGMKPKDNMEVNAEDIRKATLVLSQESWQERVVRAASLLLVLNESFMQASNVPEKYRQKFFRDVHKIMEDMRSTVATTFMKVVDTGVEIEQTFEMRADY